MTDRSGMSRREQQDDVAVFSDSDSDSDSDALTRARQHMSGGGLLGKRSKKKRKDENFKNPPLLTFLPKQLFSQENSVIYRTIKLCAPSHISQHLAVIDFRDTYQSIKHQQQTDLMFKQALRMYLKVDTKRSVHRNRDGKSHETRKSRKQMRRTMDEQHTEFWCGTEGVIAKLVGKEDSVGMRWTEKCSGYHLDKGNQEVQRHFYVMDAGSSSGNNLTCIAVVHRYKTPDTFVNLDCTLFTVGITSSLEHVQHYLSFRFSEKVTERDFPSYSDIFEDSRNTAEEDTGGGILKRIHDLNTKKQLSQYHRIDQKNVTRNDTRCAARLRCKRHICPTCAKHDDKLTFNSPLVKESFELEKPGRNRGRYDLVGSVGLGLFGLGTTAATAAATAMVAPLGWLTGAAALAVGTAATEVTKRGYEALKTTQGKSRTYTHDGSTIEYYEADTGTFNSETYSSLCTVYNRLVLDIAAGNADDMLTSVRTGATVTWKEGDSPRYSRGTIVEKDAGADPKYIIVHFKPTMNNIIRIKSTDYNIHELAELEHFRGDNFVKRVKSPSGDAHVQYNPDSRSETSVDEAIKALPGSLILQIDGKSARRKTYDEVVGMLKKSRDRTGGTVILQINARVKFIKGNQPEEEYDAVTILNPSELSINLGIGVRNGRYNITVESAVEQHKQPTEQLLVKNTLQMSGIHSDKSKTHRRANITRELTTKLFASSPVLNFIALVLTTVLARQATKPYAKTELAPSDALQQGSMEKYTAFVQQIAVRRLETTLAGDEADPSDNKFRFNSSTAHIATLISACGRVLCTSWHSPSKKDKLDVFNVLYLNNIDIETSACEMMHDDAWVSPVGFTLDRTDTPLSHHFTTPVSEQHNTLNNSPNTTESTEREIEGIVLRNNERQPRQPRQPWQPFMLLQDDIHRAFTLQDVDSIVDQIRFLIRKYLTQKRMFMNDDRYEFYKRVGNDTWLFFKNRVAFLHRWMYLKTKSDDKQPYQMMISESSEDEFLKTLFYQSLKKTYLRYMGYSEYDVALYPVNTKVQVCQYRENDPKGGAFFYGEIVGRYREKAVSAAGALSAEQKELQPRLQKYYERHRPKHMDEIPKVLHAYERTLNCLFADLDDKYNTRNATDEEKAAAKARDKRGEQRPVYPTKYTGEPIYLVWTGLERERLARLGQQQKQPKVGTVPSSLPEYIPVCHHEIRSIGVDSITCWADFKSGDWMDKTRHGDDETEWERNAWAILHWYLEATDLQLYEMHFGQEKTRELLLKRGDVSEEHSEETKLDDDEIEKRKREYYEEMHRERDMLHAERRGIMRRCITLIFFCRCHGALDLRGYMNTTYGDVNKIHELIDRRHEKVEGRTTKSKLKKGAKVVKTQKAELFRGDAKSDGIFKRFRKQSQCVCISSKFLNRQLLSGMRSEDEYYVPDDYQHLVQGDAKGEYSAPFISIAKYSAPFISIAKYAVPYRPIAITQKMYAFLPTFIYITYLSKELQKLERVVSDDPDSLSKVYNEIMINKINNLFLIRNDGRFWLYGHYQGTLVLYKLGTNKTKDNVHEYYRLDPETSARSNLNLIDVSPEMSMLNAVQDNRYDTAGAKEIFALQSRGNTHSDGGGWFGRTTTAKPSPAERVRIQDQLEHKNAQHAPRAVSTTAQNIVLWKCVQQISKIKEGIESLSSFFDDKYIGLIFQIQFENGISSLKKMYIVQDSEYEYDIEVKLPRATGGQAASSAAAPAENILTLIEESSKFPQDTEKLQAIQTWIRQNLFGEIATVIKTHPGTVFNDENRAKACSTRPYIDKLKRFGSRCRSLEPNQAISRINLDKKERDALKNIIEKFVKINEFNNHCIYCARGLCAHVRLEAFWKIFTDLYTFKWEMYNIVIKDVYDRLEQCETQRRDAYELGAAGLTVHALNTNTSVSVRKRHSKYQMPSSLCVLSETYFSNVSNPDQSARVLFELHTDGNKIVSASVPQPDGVSELKSILWKEPSQISDDEETKRYTVTQSRATLKAAGKYAEKKGVSEEMQELARAVGDWPGFGDNTFPGVTMHDVLTKPEHAESREEFCSAFKEQFDTTQVKRMLLHFSRGNIFPFEEEQSLIDLKKDIDAFYSFGLFIKLDRYWPHVVTVLMSKCYGEDEKKLQDSKKELGDPLYKKVSEGWQQYFLAVISHIAALDFDIDFKLGHHKYRVTVTIVTTGAGRIIDYWVHEKHRRTKAKEEGGQQCLSSRPASRPRSRHRPRRRTHHTTRRRGDDDEARAATAHSARAKTHRGAPQTRRRATPGAATFAANVQRAPKSTRARRARPRAQRRTRAH